MLAPCWSGASCCPAQRFRASTGESRTPAAACSAAGDTLGVRMLSANAAAAPAAAAVANNGCAALGATLVGMLLPGAEAAAAAGAPTATAAAPAVLGVLAAGPWRCRTTSLGPLLAGRLVAAPRLILGGCWKGTV
jgi:hypothetical protein